MLSLPKVRTHLLSDGVVGEAGGGTSHVLMMCMYSARVRAQVKPSITMPRSAADRRSGGSRSRFLSGSARRPSTTASTFVPPLL